MTSTPVPTAIEHFSEPTQRWFSSAFEGATDAQSGAWDAITAGDDALVIAPTGSGKTLAGFLWSIDRLLTGEPVDPKKRLRVLYISPLKALAVDVERNLRVPLAGITAAAQWMGASVPEVTVGVRTGDTPQDERRRFTSSPPDILITTPESLFLLLTSQAREQLRQIETVIVDEVHALVHNKRGAHLALSFERLDELLERPAQRLGLSATVRPPEEVAGFLGGRRPVKVINPSSDKRFDLSVVVPIEDMADPATADPPGPAGEHGGDAAFEDAAQVSQASRSVWPHVEERLLDLVEAHKSTIVFVNARRVAERLCTRLNELANERARASERGERVEQAGRSESDDVTVARAHHGSVAREQRVLIEEELKAGRLPAVVATSSLELGIDMASVDLVVQVEAPSSVASGLQRVGRAGHQVGEVSRGVFFPKFRGDLLETSVVVERMQQGAIEAMSYPRNALDVLAQHIVAMVAMDDWEVDHLEKTVRRAAPFAELPRNALEATLDMLSGRYPSHEFAELRPRLNWDRGTGVLSGRRGAQRLAVTSGGTIPDRGLFGVFLATEGGARVGELDEEMVYESRPGDTFVLGTSSWLIEDISHDRVLVTPAPGVGGQMPFWRGDAPGRPIELGRALGAFVREVTHASDSARSERLSSAGLDRLAASNLVQYLEEQKDAAGTVPDDRTIVVERFRDEIGDWRLCVHSFFGARVHAPWAQAIETRVRDELGVDVQCIYTDDGIIVRLPEADVPPPGSIVSFDPDEIIEIVTSQVGSSALFASRFRECAARSLLLPRRRPGSRTPLWQQRQRSARLLQVASKYESFPVVLEAFRECLQDVFDLPALGELMAAIARREVRIVEVETPLPSPFASSLQFGFVASFMYEGDVPLAERRAQALSLDRSLLAEIMGREELRELLDDASLAQLELELQLLTDERKIRDADGLHDALRLLGDLTGDEIRPRSQHPEKVEWWLQELQSSRRALSIRVSGEERFIAIEDAARYRDALGSALPPGVPAAFLDPVADALGDLTGRYAARRGPFVPEDVAGRYGLGAGLVRSALQTLEIDGRVLEGEYRPGGSGREWIDLDVLRRLRRMSLAAFRKEVEPAPPEALARFVQAWHGMEPQRRTEGLRGASIDDMFRVIEQLQGVPLVASALERTMLRARLPGYRPALLDELCASGELVWCGAGPLGSDDGWISFALADRADLLLPAPVEADLSADARAVHDALASRGASFFRQIAEATGSTDDSESLLSLWELVWAGLVTNDTLAPLRSLLWGGRPSSRPSRRRRRGPAWPSRLGPPAGAGRWSLVPRRSTDNTRRAHALTEQLLERHGILTRGALASERVPGGFAGIYPVLKAMEESGRCRRGYFVDGLGGAQFALAGAVDRMRSLVDNNDGTSTAVVAATDPANPYGAALPWPDREDRSSTASGKKTGRAGRKAGAVVVLVDGRLALYVEKGGRTLLSYSDDGAVLRPAIDALVLAAREGLLGKLAVERADGEAVMDTPLAEALVDAGLRFTSRGLRLRA
ncbi:MAG: ATP-dependent helicase [Actinomycetota bacterium]